MKVDQALKFRADREILWLRVRLLFSAAIVQEACENVRGGNISVSNWENKLIRFLVLACKCAVANMMY